MMKAQSQKLELDIYNENRIDSRQNIPERGTQFFFSCPPPRVHCDTKNV